MTGDGREWLALLRRHYLHVKAGGTLTEADLADHVEAAELVQQRLDDTTARAEKAECDLRLALRASEAADDTVLAVAPQSGGFFACGPSSAKCKCRCPESCEHVWDGPTKQLPDGNGETATCSRCGAWAIEHDLWVCP